MKMKLKLSASVSEATPANPRQLRLTFHAVSCRRSVGHLAHAQQQQLRARLRGGACFLHLSPSRIAFLPRQASRHGFFSSRQEKEPGGSKSPASKTISVIVIAALLTYSLYPTDGNVQSNLKPTADGRLGSSSSPSPADAASEETGQGPWSSFTSSFEGISFTSQLDAARLSDRVVDMLLPEWSKSIPAYVRKLQRELNMAPGSLAQEIWQEASDPSIHPEVQYAAKVRVSEHLCDDEKTFLERRRKVIAPALARYLGVQEDNIHPDDVPVIAMCGSGGGLRALVAGTGSLMASTEDGLLDCATYTSGVSGSCWLQSIVYSSIAKGDLQRAADHLKARLGIHIAYPPAAFSSLISAPTNKYLLSGMVEKLKGDPGANFGLVDVYGVLLASRLLVPKGELGVNEKDFKLSNQQEYVRYGQNPLPIYTAVRHEIPEVDPSGSKAPGTASEEAKETAKKEGWFQWFEVTPYEFFCEEFTAGIPTWAMGRKFKNGLDQPTDEGLRLPEVRMPFLLGIWGSAFCATLSHYYREVRPLIQSLSGFQAVDDLIWGRNKDLSKVHPIDPASIPNFAYGMKDGLPQTVPPSIYGSEYIQLMDAGMSNNLPIYPLLRPGRDVEIIVAFDASADIKTDNWLSVVEGYARQRGIKGWPIGAGWPKESESPSSVVDELDEAASVSSADAEKKLSEAKADQATRCEEGRAPGTNKAEELKQAEKTARELGYCTVWVGTTQERESSDPPPPPIDDVSSWKLTEPDAGIALVYLPFLANPKALVTSVDSAGNHAVVDPAVSEYLSTWNFVYTPEQIDDVVALARANYDEGREQIRATVRGVYERKKKKRLERERAMAKQERYRRLIRLGMGHKLGHDDDDDDDDA
ncbi:acyl transferase/acyl hydrolase/lysophospholipase [Lasiosphaeria miniovina]|uniref:Lysophospholipase n=1 Tax=Lasiosphaeria miniovina TaxID=1954250 RepID=A0AA40AM09_9PEZI|nr:acyl transferase/acyl hydrolase/lysophospholipase [Lasiosphaeria miniovina]KAK0718328.1 acyl transferase/acyl hydrolase/lysophospholipase [Lasiosphaeria miniovina]